MTEEEKKAILNLGNCCDFYALDESNIGDLRIALTAIYKLQRENERLKSEHQLEIDTAEEVLKWKGKYYFLSRKINVVSRDEVIKLKEKILLLLDDKVLQAGITQWFNDLLKEK